MRCAEHPKSSGVEAGEKSPACCAVSLSARVRLRLPLVLWRSGKSLKFRSSLQAWWPQAQMIADRRRNERRRPVTTALRHDWPGRSLRNLKRTRPCRWAAPRPRVGFAGTCTVRGTTCLSCSHFSFNNAETRSVQNLRNGVTNKLFSPQKQKKDGYCAEPSVSAAFIAAIGGLLEISPPWGERQA